jgi:hypothetical protein
MALGESAIHSIWASERTIISSTCIYAGRGRRVVTSLTRQDFRGTTEIQKEVIGRSLGL